MAIITTAGGVTFGVGDTIAIHQKVKEEGKTRTQVFEGIVLGIKGTGVGKSFTVRKFGAGNIGIERIFPVHSPVISKIEITRQGHKGSRRAKLYYLRDKPKRSYEEIYKRANKKQQTKSATQKKSKSQKPEKPKLSAKKTTSKKSPKTNK